MSEEYFSLEKMRRKRDQAWENAGCARVDGDKADEASWTKEAREWERKIGELVRS